ncbi:hypothetical protein JXO59_10225 [candidate division KSB1 bacterium]|nr:hypothetical protein [candidate division KSB1 bacterium]
MERSNPRQNGGDSKPCPCSGDRHAPRQIDFSIRLNRSARDDKEALSLRAKKQGMKKGGSHHGAKQSPPCPSLSDAKMTSSTQ